MQSAFMGKTIPISAVVPWSGKRCIDDWALGILCAHDKNILWKKNTEKAQYITDITDTGKSSRLGNDVWNVL